MGLNFVFTRNDFHLEFILEIWKKYINLKNFFQRRRN